MDTTRRDFVGIGAAAAAVAPSLARAAGAQPAHAQPSTAKDKFWVAAATPCDKNYKFDPGAYRDMLAWWKANGADGVLVLGTNGEGPSFSVAERKLIAQTALKNKNGLDIIVATGTANFHEAIDLSRHAADAGADSVLIQPPFYYKNPPGDGVVRYFSLIFDQVKTPVRYYHIPKTTGVPVDLTVFRALAEHPNFIGLKDSNGDPAEYETIANGLPTTLNVISGTDNNMEAALTHGNGVILGSGNVFTRQVAAIFAARRAGQDIKAPLKKLADAEALLQASGYSASYNVIKYALSQMMGAPLTYSRPPHAEVSEEDKANIRRGVAQLKEMG